MFRLDKMQCNFYPISQLSLIDIIVSFIIYVSWTIIMFIWVTTVVAEEIWTEVKESDKVFVSEMSVAYFFSVESIPSASVSRDWARVTKDCMVVIIVTAEVMAFLFVLFSALAVALDIAEALLLTVCILTLAWYRLLRVVLRDEVLVLHFAT